MAPSWLNQRERGSMALLRFMVWLACRLGRSAVRPLLFPITAYFFMTSRAGRRASFDFLGRVLARQPSYRDVFHHFFCFATTILDRVYFFASRSDAFEIKIADPDQLLARTEAGKGAILLGAHLGSFDMLRAFILQRPGLKLKVLMRIQHNQMITGALAALAPEIAQTLQPISSPADLLRLRELLDAGYIIALLGDRAVPDDRLVKVEFLGAPAFFPASPVQLAGMLDAPVFTFFGLYRGGRRYEAYFDLLAERIKIPRAERQRATEAWVGRYADRLAHYCRLAPFNWFNFFPFWHP